MARVIERCELPESQVRDHQRPARAQQRRSESVTVGRITLGKQANGPGIEIDGGVQETLLHEIPAGGAEDFREVNHGGLGQTPDKCLR